MRLDGSEQGAVWAWWADMLGRRTGEAVWIGELVADQVHIVHQAVRPEDVVQVLGGDGAIPWYACALGQAIVAGLDEVTREALLARPAVRLTGLTITDPVELREVLVLTRHRGYAVEAHAATLGDAGIAAPVIHSPGPVSHAIGIVGPAERLLAPERQPGLAEAVCAAAQAMAQGTGTA